MTSYVLYALRSLTRMAALGVQYPRALWAALLLGARRMPFLSVDTRYDQNALKAEKRTRRQSGTAVGWAMTNRTVTLSAFDHVLV
ncbi:MAG: hypothetical protein ACR2OX_02625, partial [Methyloligellaceae bacterium]